MGIGVWHVALQGPLCFAGRLVRAVARPTPSESVGCASHPVTPEGIDNPTLDLADAGLVGRYVHSSLHRA